MLSGLFADCGLKEVREGALIAQLDFASFDDYWSPFLTGQGPSGGYATSLSPERREALRKHLYERVLGDKQDRPFSMSARAWAVRGTVTSA